MNLLVLIGIAIIVIGFALKLDVLAVVLLAGVATGIELGQAEVVSLTVMSDE